MLRATLGRIYQVMREQDVNQRGSIRGSTAREKEDYMKALAVSSYI